jgi:hypothetical protein
MLECRTKRLLETPNIVSFVIARSVFVVKCAIAKFYLWFETNERRGNLPSLIHIREIFNDYEITSLRTQSRKIASGIQQCLAKFAFVTPSSKPRNDEIKYLPH